MIGKYFYHGTDIGSFIKILDTNEIKCRRLIEMDNIKARRLSESLGPGCNGMDYISLCRLNDYSYESESAYKVFVKDRYCFIISSEINAIKTLDFTDPEVRKIYDGMIPYSFIGSSDSSLRFSNMKDEWQVKTRVPLQYIIGIGIPFNRLQGCKYNYYIVQRALALADIYHLDVVDTSEPRFIEKYEASDYKSDARDKIKRLVYGR